jgi:Domain of unknown function (DUF5615)
LRVLLDEMYPASIAAQLRRRGHDVDALTGRPELRSLSDRDVFAKAQDERRAVVTENIGDFSQLADEADARGQAHYGLVLVDPAKYPRGDKRTIGRLVSGLAKLMKERPGNRPESLRHWV